jgi:hypothetical protein
VHQAAVIDTRAGRVAINKGRQHGQRRTDLTQVEHQARQDTAGDARQAAAAHVHQHAAAQVGQNARRHLAKLRPPVGVNDGQVLQKASAQIQLAVAGDLIGDHHHARAGHGSDARVAAQGDCHAVVAVGHHGVGQHFFLGHSHRATVEKDHAATKQDANQRIQFGGR